MIHVAFQMDPLERLHRESDTTLTLAFEAQKRGYTVWHYQPQNLMVEEGILKARACKMSLSPSKESLLKTPEILRLDTCQVVWIRQNPPFDMSYMTTTYLLEYLPPTTLVLNNPAGIRNAPEKLLVGHFQPLTPPTLITCDRGALYTFLQKHQEIVLKPLYDFGGKGVCLIKAQDNHLEAVLDLYEKVYPFAFVAQKFLSQIKEGDKRLLLVNGEVVGGYKRIPKSGDIRSNLAVGGEPQSYHLNSRDHEICQTIGPILKNMGLFLVGIDIIGDYLTEINVTSPTGINTLNFLEKTSLETHIWDKIESHWRA